MQQIDLQLIFRSVECSDYFGRERSTTSGCEHFTWQGKLLLKLLLQIKVSFAVENLRITFRDSAMFGLLFGQRGERERESLRGRERERGERVSIRASQ